MKISAGTLRLHIAVLVWCIFMGITAVSIGVGAMYPPLNLVAKPFVCPNGQMTFNETTSNPLPGTTYTTIGWYCVDKQKETTTPLDIFQIAVAAGPIYGLVIEALVLIAIFFYNRSNRAPSGQAHSRTSGTRLADAKPYHANQPATEKARLSTEKHSAPPSENALARMKELKQLRAEEMISEAEYQKKRDEILKDL